jgi:hypothetical protein
MMRAVFVSLVAIAFATSTAAAQDESPVFGVFGGATQSRLVGWSSVGPGISNRNGATFGGYGLVPLNPSWTLQIGGSYSQKGWRRLLPGTLDTSVVKIDYFEVPVQGRFDLGITHPVGAFAAGGLSLGVRGQCSVSSLSASAGDTTTVSCGDVKRLSGGSIGYRVFDLGALFTGGLRVAMGHLRLLAFAQYGRGLLNVNTNASGQNQTLSFGGGLEWRFGQ